MKTRDEWADSYADEFIDCTIGITNKRAVKELILKIDEEVEKRWAQVSRNNVMQIHELKMKLQEAESRLEAHTRHVKSR